MSHCRIVIAVVLAVSALSLQSRGQEIKPLFYASMDEGKVDGKVGKAGAFKRIEARDKIDLDRGTLAFFTSYPKEIAISEPRASPTRSRVRCVLNE